MFTMEEQCQQEFKDSHLIGSTAFLDSYNPRGKNTVTQVHEAHISHQDSKYQMIVPLKSSKLGTVEGFIEWKHDTWDTGNTVGEIWGSISKEEIEKEREGKKIVFPSANSTRFSADGSRDSEWAKNSYEDIHDFLIKTIPLDISYAKLGYAFAKQGIIGEHSLFQYYHRSLERKTIDGIYQPTGKVLRRTINIYNGDKFREIVTTSFYNKECDLQICSNSGKGRFWASINALVATDLLTEALLAEVHLSDDKIFDRIECFKVFVG